ncbi:MAG: bL17 family ribosomal protein [Planctomycetota bacterium]|jgi:large subunit ribosomal protein L17
MRHKRRGRKLGRNPAHQRALLRNLASALILTERDKELFDSSDPKAPKAPKVPGRIITTWQKAKEVRPLLERCITIARRALPHQEAADVLEPDADRDSPQWQGWRKSDEWQEWNRTIAPVVAARRRALKLLGDKEAVRILFEEIAPRFEDRDGGYTRVLRLAKPRLGDAGQQAILELVGTHERQRRKAAPKPSFEDEIDETDVRDVAPATDEAEAPDEAEAEVGTETEAEDEETVEKDD